MADREELEKLPPGTMIDHFRVMRLAGRGGHAAVYLARDTKLGRKVALKLIVPKALGSKTSVDQFLFEARATAAFSHPHIVTVYGVGEHQGAPYVALEYLEGKNLRARMAEDPPGTKEALRILLAIAEALREAHAHKILHRDLKPENVIIPGDGRLRVVDFGLAKLIGASEDEDFTEEPEDGGELDRNILPTRTVRSRRAAGTPQYMAPEQWLAEELTAATDLWAFGVLFYELIAGRRPFDAPTKQELGQMVVGAVPAPKIPPSAQLTPELLALATRALDRLPHYRPTAQDFVAALELALFPSRAMIADEKSPFRGLLPFGERHADIFFGRDGEVSAFLERLRERPVLPIIGPSGAGKSSFVQAGIIPQLREQGKWIVIRFRPGYRPFESLALRLLLPEGPDGIGTISPRTDPRSTDGRSSDARSGDARSGESLPAAEATPDDPALRDESARLAEKLIENPLQLGLQLRALAERARAKILIFIDQLEELYTLTPDPEIRRKFLESICAAADDVFDPTRVIFTVRDDFMGKLVSVERARDALGQALVLYAPDEAALLEILTRPLSLTDYRYEDDAIPREMIREVAGEPAALALLQFACQALWDRRDRRHRLLLRASYREVGGVAGALATHADGALASLSPAQLRIARQILLRSITPERTRRTLSEARALEGLEADARIVLDRLIASRLLTVRKGRSGDSETEAQLELAHESLVDTWQTLARWIEESKDELAFLAEIGQAAELWEKRGCPADEVWQGDALAGARRSLAKMTTQIPAGVARFVAAAEARRKRSTLRRRAITAAAFLGVSFLAAMFYEGKQVADRERRRAEVRRAEALREGAEGALIRGDVWEARARIRTSLELADSIEARALWTRLREEKTIWRKIIPGASAIAFSPDGRSLLVQAEEPELQVFDTRTFAEGSMAGISGSSGVYDFVYSPSGRYFALGTGTGEIELRDLVSGTKLRLRGHEYSIARLQFGPDERTLLSTGWDRTARLWSVPSGAALGILRGHGDRVYGGAFSPSGGSVATSSWDQTIRVWNLSDQTVAHVLRGHADKVVDVAYSPSGRLLASACEDGTIGLWDAATGQQIRMLHGHLTRVSRIVFSPRGEILFSASWDGSTRAWEVSTGRELGVIGEHGSILQTIALSPDGRTLAALSHDGELRLTRVDELVPRAPPAPGPLPGLAIEPQGRWIASTAPEHRVALWDGKTGQIARELAGHTNTVRALAFSPGGELLASAGFDGTVRLWKPETGAAVRILMGHTRPVSAVAFAPDGERVISASFDQTARVWSARSGAELGVLSHEQRLSSVAVSPDGRRLATGSFDGRIALWDLRTLRPLENLACGTDRIVHVVAFSPAGDRLAAYCGPVVRVWELAGGARSPSREVPQAGTPSQAYTCLAFDPARAGRLAHSTAGGAAFTELATGERHDFAGAVHEASFCAFAASARALVTLDDDGALRLRDPERGRPVWRAPFLDAGTSSTSAWRRAIELHADRAELAPDRGHVCLLADEGRLELWDVARDARIAETPLALEGATTLEARAGREGACAVIAGGRAQLFEPRSSGLKVLAEHAAAIAFEGSELLIAVPGSSKHSTIARYTQSGPGEVRTASSASAATAILAQPGRLVLGFGDGHLELLTPDPHPLPAKVKSAVTKLIEGPGDTLIAGLSDGTVQVLEAATGLELLSFHLHGPIRHLALDHHHLQAITEIGNRRTLDLSPLQGSDCDLLQTLWPEAPAVWERGTAIPRDPPAEHRCRLTRKD